MNSQPTHYMSRPTCLDHFATSSPQKVNTVVTTGPTLSNHSAVILYKDGHPKQSEGFTRIVTDYSRADWNKINDLLTSHQWPALFEGCDLDAVASKWTEDFNYIIRSCTPSKKITIREGDKKWMN